MKPEASEPAGSGGSGGGLAKTAGIVAVLTVLSKVVGLVRDMVVAWAYGVSVIADAYNFAYLFTGNILILFGGLGGPFHSSTVSVLNSRKDQRDSGVLVMQITLITTLVLLAVTVAAFFAAPHMVLGLRDLYAQMSAVTVKDQFELETLKQLRLMLPLIVISGWVGISYGVLNVFNKIATPSLSPAIASIAIIAAVYYSYWQTGGSPSGIALAAGTLIGAVGQFLIQLPFLKQLHFNWEFSAKPHPGLVEYSHMLWPAVFSTSIGQLTVYVDAYFALQEQAAWTAIVNSNRLVQLPLGILLTAMLVPILPRFTEHVDAGKIDDLKHDMRRALRVLWFLALPMSAILLAIPRPLVEVLFMRGRFDEHAAELVTVALLFLVPSIFFYVARDLMTRVFYAYKDSQTPYRIALLAIFVKAGLDYTLIAMTQERIASISAATSIMTVFNLSLLVWALKKKTGSLGLVRLVQPLAVMLGATIVCGVSCWGVYSGLTTWIGEASNVWVRLAYVGAASCIALALYLGVCLIAKLDEPRVIAGRVPGLRRLVGQ